MNRKKLFFLIIGWISFSLSFIQSQPFTSKCPLYNTFTTSCEDECESTDDGCVVYANDIQCIDSQYGNCKTGESIPCQIQCLEKIIRPIQMDNRIYQFVLFIDKPKRGDWVQVPARRIGKIDFTNNAPRFMDFKGDFATSIKGNYGEFKLTGGSLAPLTSVNELIIQDLDLTEIKMNELPIEAKNITLINCNLKQFPGDLARENNKITYLSLAKNNIMEIPNEESTLFNGLKSITELSLSENNLKEFKQILPNLVKLDLSWNELSIFPSTLTSENYPRLNQLIINKNKFVMTSITSEQCQLFRRLDIIIADFGSPANCPDSNEICDIGNGERVCISEAGIIDPSKDKKGNSIGVIIGSIFGSISALGILLCYMWKRRQHTHNDLENPMLPRTEKYPTDNGIHPLYPLPDRYDNDPILVEHQVSYDNIILLDIIAKGGFGVVWKGEYEGTAVAVKRMLPDRASPEEAEDFVDEIKIMARLHHKRIVRFIGVAWTNLENLSAISEYMDCGDLRRLLANHTVKLTWKNQKLRITIEIVEALVYLHSLNPLIIHRDLKARNVLVDSELGCKLSDFGLSRNRSLDETMTCGIGTVRWIAPEIALGERYTEKADIYSLGVVMSEIQTRKLPYHDSISSSGVKLSEVAIVHEVAKCGLRPDFGTECPSTIYKLAQDCMLQDPNERPTAKQILDRLIHQVKEEVENMEIIEEIHESNSTCSSHSSSLKKPE